MTHECRFRNLETFEDEDGYLFIRVLCNMPFGKEHSFRVEYCPVCGSKGKISHISGVPLRVYSVEDVTEISRN